MFNKHCSQLAKVSRGEQWLDVHKKKRKGKESHGFQLFCKQYIIERTGIVSQIKIQA